MKAEPVLVALPGTLCSPAVFEPLAGVWEAPGGRIAH
jgi:hypothetical protein